ncbi:thiopeptide-type bacteriocin biosynthesis protein [Kitasatospora sp. NPDC094011]|uniref:thiopeptide-type bacteriocin biosynthesis protein n=1 Tax=Kitasatospora sp. NPDC094011 TaxID=3364090 RepID=UPI0037F6C645
MTATSMLQLHVRFTDQAAAEPAALALLRPAILDAEAAGHLESWHFIRKGDVWRVRYQVPEGANPEKATGTMTDALADSRVSGWTEVIYEPEVYAFGGEFGMDTAHRLFYEDSRHVLDHLATPGEGDRRRELAILLVTALLRGAEQEWHEQGDVWAQVAAHRSAEASPEQLARLGPALERLVSVDTGPGSTLASGALAFAAPWLDVHTRAGQRLVHLAHSGQLTRGLRAVLAYHLIFHFNRMGLPPAAQGAIASTASSIVFGKE